MKQSFFNFFLLTLNNYLGYFRPYEANNPMVDPESPEKGRDMMNSNEVFDFDSYLESFKSNGLAYSFMQRLIYTQSFSNFIEETFRLGLHMSESGGSASLGDGKDASKTQLGFFKVNLEVLMDHGYHRLRKEQNLMIDHMLLKLYNPVKFSVSHILKQYKKGVTYQAMSSDQYLGDQDNLTPVLEQILKKEISDAPNSQAGVLDRINLRLISEMPGI